MNILRISRADIDGGAEKTALSLHEGCRKLGHHSYLAVGEKQSSDPSVRQISRINGFTFWHDCWKKIGDHFYPFAGHVKGAGKLCNFCYFLARQPEHWYKKTGYENFYFPGSARLLDGWPEKPDILHFHNLHGEYFDLRILARLSTEFPVVLTLHDAWLLGGHCAHSLDCERWKIGCGQCPDLTIYPAIYRDATAHNWKRKQKIYQKSRLYIATPSRWLMQKVDQSMLAPSIIEKRVIPNGIDLSLFSPRDKAVIRQQLNISPESRVLLFMANNIKHNPFKDIHTLQTAIKLLAQRLPEQRIVFMVLGEEGTTEQIYQTQIKWIGFQKDASLVADYLRAADIYLHAAKAETFPRTILEAMACGTPVIASAVGGIPEQVEHKNTGILVPPGDPDILAASIQQLLTNNSLRRKMGENSRQKIQRQFSLERMTNEYLTWYQEILTSWHK